MKPGKGVAKARQPTDRPALNFHVAATSTLEATLGANEKGQVR